LHNDNIYSDLDAVILKAIEIKQNGMVEPIYVGLSNSLEDPLNKSIENSNRLIDATDLFFKEVNLHYYKIGYQEGVNETSIKIAKNLLDVLSIEEISTATSLTIDEIKKIKGASIHQPLAPILVSLFIFTIYINPLTLKSPHKLSLQFFLCNHHSTP